MTMISGSAPPDGPDDRRRPDLNGPAGRQFQTVLVSLGVGQPRGLPVARLAALSGVSRETWRRCANEGGLPTRKLEAIPAMAAALRECGCHITDEQLQEAFMADLAARHTKLPTFRASTLESSASPADQLVNVIRGLTGKAERVKFIQHAAAILSFDERMDVIAGMAHPQEETGRDGSRDSINDGDGDGSTNE
jgi:hypothetical protein